MKRTPLTTIVVTLLLLLTGALQPIEAKRKLTREERDSVSYALATLWSKYLREKALKDSEPKVTADYMRGLTEALKQAEGGNAYYKGLHDGIVIDSRLHQVEELGGFDVDRERIAYIFSQAAKGRTTRFTPESADAYMNRLMATLNADERIADASEAWLDSIAGAAGVRKSLTGMMYEPLEYGSGEPPVSGDATVMVEYVGRLYDGKEFDATDPGRPAKFMIKNLISGFAEGLRLMRPGAHFKLYIPASLAYGEQGVPGVIPSNAALMFDVKLLEVIPPEPAVK